MTPPPAIALRRGDAGPAVAAVCERLVLTGDLPGDVPGGTGHDGGSTRSDAPVFDERVEQAVKSFQQRRGLLVDGIVGRQTYAVLDGARWALGDRVLRYIPDYFVEGDDVVALQARLAELGFTPGTAARGCDHHAQAMNSSSSRSSLGLGWAPTMLLTTWPLT